jgi:hypothetical protein
MIHYLRQLLVVGICLLQIAGIQLATKTYELSRTETATKTVKVPAVELVQAIPDKESVHLFVRESYNNSKHATLQPFCPRWSIFIQAPRIHPGYQNGSAGGNG